MRKILYVLITALLSVVAAPNPLSFDKTVHDFGTIRMKDGPVSCDFSVTNTGQEAVNIYAVLTSCGCTAVEWTRTDIPPGGIGVIHVTYSNQEGPYPFDKVLRVYVSGCEKPFPLHIKGIVKKK